MSVRIGLSSLIALCVVLNTGAAQTSGRTSVEALTQSPASPPIQTLIEQLGASKFQEREQASAALLKIGEPALLALSAAERGTDIEIGQRAQAIRQRIEREQFESISQSFKRDPDASASYGLPGWKSFSSAAGSSRPAKRLFLKMLERQRIVAHCLESLDGGQVPLGLFDGLPEEPQARLRAVMGKTCADLRLDLMSGHGDPHAGDLVALLIAENRLEEPMQDLHETIRMECIRGGLDRLMSMPGAANAARKTVGGWFRRAPLVYGGEIFNWATQYRIADASFTARRVLEAQMDAEMTSRALQTLSNFGSKEDLPLIDRFIDDKTIVSEFVPNTSFEGLRVDALAPPNLQAPNRRPNEINTYQQTVGDMAVASGSKIAGFDLHALFPIIVIEDLLGIQAHTVGFPKNQPELRTKAVESYKTQRARAQPPSS